ncbi:Regulator of G protein signaling 3 [Fasciola gigantica]|uniref:Regulator of G protein signaling 3 n=1 Tax=Fasciola gigantica TaxID=46835 RepID=A0A504YEJ4_FASGI|nr:Regulator of G protein signaling 3 [Fasciola gigantica]
MTTATTWNTMARSDALHHTELGDMTNFESGPRKPVSLQNLSFGCPRSTLSDPIWISNSELLCNTESKTAGLKIDTSSSPTVTTPSGTGNQQKRESSQSGPSTVGYNQLATAEDKIDVVNHSAHCVQTGTDFFGSEQGGIRFYGSTSGPSSTKRTKIGIPFFRPKPSSPNQSKSVQMKELKRMIRAGKPSYEQIHSWGHSFEALLNDRFGLALFKDFLSTEFSDENIAFWIACQEYKQITNPKKLAARAQRIYAEFIAVQANREVNLDSKTRLQTEAGLANPNIQTLDNAQKRIQALMEKDSYRRFIRSEVYLTLYTEAREVAKAAAASALAASLQEASDELDGAVLHLVNTASSNSPFSFLSNLGSGFASTPGPGLHLPGVAAAAASAEAGMNNVQDLQLLGLSTSRHMRCMQENAASASGRVPAKSKLDGAGKAASRVTTCTSVSASGGTTSETAHKTESKSD